MIFAFIWTTFQTFEVWSPSLELHEGEEAPVTVRLPASYFRITLLRNEYHYLNTSSSSCPHLVPKGELVVPDKECTGLLKAFEGARRPVHATKVIGFFVFYLLVGMLLGIFMRGKHMRRARWLRSQITVFLMITMMLAISKALLLLTALPAQIIPVTMVPLLASYFLRKHLTYGVTLASALLAASLVNFDIEVLMVQFITGVSSVIVLGNKRRTRVHLKAGAMAAWVAVAASMITTLLFSGTLNVYDDISEHFDPRYSIWLASLFSGLGSGVIAWITAPLAGIMFGEVSRGKLLDLQELDHPLLRILREKAPSTWEHSRAMANLAEAAAHAIGANALLIRVGAYFHDVGKSSKPEYFIENQAGGQNPHDQLTPHESARAIFQHVTEGVKLLRREGVPEDIIEFAYSHHGSGILEFFWHKNLADGNLQELEEKDFSYPGHPPTTRETGILMLVDAVEAAARTIDGPDKIQFETLLQRIAFSKLTQGQLDETGLSVMDMRVVINTIVDTLVSMHHARIKYPWQTESTGISGKQAQINQKTAIPDDAANENAASAPEDTPLTPVPKAPKI